MTGGAAWYYLMRQDYQIHFLEDVTAMIRRTRGYLTVVDGSESSSESRMLESEGYTVLRSLLSSAEVDELRLDISRVYDELPGDNRAGKYRSDPDDLMFRYEMLNRSAACQRAIAHAGILEVIECLLGEDCHIIANTAWRNPAEDESSHGGQAWHIDAGPHIPLAEGATWPSDIPHPVFAIGVHIYLQDCALEDGPTGVIPGSHLSGRFPPREHLLDDKLKYNGVGVKPLLANAGDVGFFVSDIWHRRMPILTSNKGRFFLQAHYGRRDIAQRLHTTEQNNQLSDDAISRAKTPREKTIIGLHEPKFYDG
jgi:ectoine hydroxylase-related dioxygenase (phytanoyl-CoA dioxygenase family)